MEKKVLSRNKTDIKKRKIHYNRLLPNIKNITKRFDLKPNLFLDLIAPLLIIYCLFSVFLATFDEFLLDNVIVINLIEIILCTVFFSAIFISLKIKKSKLLKIIIFLSSIVFMMYFLLRGFDYTMIFKLKPEFISRLIAFFITLFFYIYIRWILSFKKRGFIKASMSISSIFISLDAYAYISKVMGKNLSINNSGYIIYFITIIIILIFVHLYKKSLGEKSEYASFLKFRLSNLLFPVVMVFIFLLSLLVNPLKLNNETSELTPKDHMQKLLNPAMKIYDFILNDAKLPMPSLSPENLYRILEWLDLADPNDWEQEQVDMLLDYFNNLPESSKNEFISDLLKPPMTEIEKALFEKILSETSAEDFSQEMLNTIEDAMENMGQDDQNTFKDDYEEWIGGLDEKVNILDEQSKILENMMADTDPNSLTDEEWNQYDNIASSLDPNRHKDVLAQYNNFKNQVVTEVSPPPTVTCKICPEGNARSLLNYNGTNLQNLDEKNRIVYPKKTVDLKSYFNVNDLLLEYGLIAYDYDGNEIPMTVRLSTVNVNIIGLYEVVYFAVDSKGNETDDDHVIPVEVVDILAPIIEGPTTLEYLALFDEIPDWKKILRVSDNYDNISDIQLTMTKTFYGDMFRIEDVGSYDVYFEAIDSSGNRSVMHRVTVIIKKETVAPIINGPDEIKLTTYFNDKIIWENEYQVIDYIKENPNVTHLNNFTTLENNDNISISQFGSYNKAGIYYITLTATDASGNISNKVVTVIIEDELVAPTISCVSEIGIITYYTKYPDWSSYCTVSDNISDIRNSLEISDNNIAGNIVKTIDDYIEQIYINGSWENAGSVSILVTVRDLTGNTSSTSVTLTLTLEEVPPNINYLENEIINSNGMISGNDIDNLVISYFSGEKVPNWNNLFQITDGPYSGFNYSIVATFSTNDLYISNGIFSSAETFSLTIYAEDISGNSNTKTITIQIKNDEIAPTISINEDLKTWFEHRTGDTPSNTELLNYFSIYDNKDGVINPLVSMLTINYKVTENATPVIVQTIDANNSGYYIITINVYDEAGNHATKDFEIQVSGKDETAPVIIVNPNELDIDFLYRVGAVPTISQLKNYFKIVDNKDGIILDKNLNIDNSDYYTIKIFYEPDGSNTEVGNINVLQAGIYQIIIYVSDIDDNSGNNSLENKLFITVLPKDTNAPIFNNNISEIECYDTQYEKCIEEEYLKNLLDIVDNIDSTNIIIQWIEIGDEIVNGVGVYTINVIAIDMDNNESSHLLRVNFLYDNPPTIELKDGHILEFDEDQININWSEYFNIQDNTKIASVDYNFLGDLSIPKSYLDKLVVTATDEYGRQTIAYFTITIVDITPPNISLSNNCNGISISDVMYVDQGTSAFDFRNCFNVSDNVAILSTKIVDNIIYDEGVMNNIGIYLVTLTAVDERNNTSSLDLTVVVVDKTNPTIEKVANLEFNEDTKFPNLKDYFIFSDNYTSEKNLFISFTGFTESDMNTPGKYNLVVYVADEENNSTTKNFQVTIFDVTSPIIKVNSTCTFDRNEDDKVASYNEGTLEVDWITCFDILDDSSITNFEIKSEVPITNSHMKTIGTFPITVQVTDVYSNYTEEVFFIKILDVTKPVIIKLNDEVVEVQANYNNIKPSWDEVLKKHYLLFDNYDEELYISEVSSVSEPLNLAILKTFNLSFFVTDSAGNKSDIVYFDLNVIDTQSPDILGEDTIEISHSSKLPNFGNMYLIKDNYDGIINFEENMIKNNIDTTILGEYTMLITATDSNKNTITKKVTVKIVDNTAPRFLSGPNDIRIREDDRLPDIISMFKIEDNYDINLNVWLDTSNINFSKIGTYSMKIYASDSSGNIAERSIEVVVIEKALLTKVHELLTKYMAVTIILLFLIIMFLVLSVYFRIKKYRLWVNALTTSDLILHYYKKIVQKFGKELIPMANTQTLMEYKDTLKEKYEINEEKLNDTINIAYKTIYSKNIPTESDLSFIKDFYYNEIKQIKSNKKEKV